MYFPTLFCALTTLTIAAAVPVAAGSSMTTPTPTQAIVDPSEAYPVDYPWMTPVGAYQCPQEQVKRCCMSLEQTSRMLIDGVGELVPVVNGLSISSQISFHCKDMADGVDPNTCNQKGYAPMCCNSGGGSSGADGCKPFEEVKEKYYKSFGYNKDDQSQADYIMEAVS
ncbi:hypothetical protein PEBR_25464 [Penicillium brasilianum]|uniref:Hydrophobin n=1 Tax=Penicillium brasilianum TaxID=104259 RepID=A0A1S9RJU3_PENBI|nr:hypothetical protein PEBR_25464 [Penicillium brasilianum]